MALFSSLVFVAFCLLHIASPAQLRGEVPKCERLGADALRMEERGTLVVQLNEAMKNVELTEYSCPMESTAKFSVHIPNYERWPHSQELRHEEPSSSGYGPLVQNAIKEWAPELEKMTGSRSFGCNYETVHGKITLVCLVVRAK
ncbi:hypothetical protein Y032_0039g111 [Ancylostoma ceylanicum]|uniref:SCP domain-containing protein n=2 Tax=Ancylostoma ceylanicum TaxID=53326 RepID=A0A016UIN8_9BILA|nr:hypothetical protein Y032_0039g111 [Ancylostoma ceylanicum]